MKLFSKEPQARAMQSLIHDTNRDLMQMDHVIKKLSIWMADNCKKMNQADIQTSYPFVAIEYLKKSSLDIKRDIDNYYKYFQNDFKDEEKS